MKIDSKHLSRLPVLTTGLGLVLAGPATAQTFKTLLAAVLLLIPALAQAQLDYTTNNGTITITGGCPSPSSSGAVTIPATVNGLPVASIGSGAFYECLNLNSITIPTSVTSILGWEFRGCASLTRITIGNSVASIGMGAFFGCTSLTNISIPDSVTNIGDWAFFGCTSLTSITIGNRVASIGMGAFFGCTSLTNISIPNSVTSIGDSNSTADSFDEAFEGCTSLTAIAVDPSNPSFTSADGVLFDKSQTTLITCPAGKAGAYIIPSSVTSISDGAFSGCTSLTSITIGNSVTSIGGGTFEGCASLTSITIPNSVTSIWHFALSDCTSLTSITIPNSVITILDGAFSGCTSLTSITIGNSVTSIGNYAFQGCTSLTAIAVDPANPSFASADGVLFDKSQTTLITCPVGKAGAYITPSSVTSMSDGAFYGCASLTSITIPSSVTNIGIYAFAGCTSLRGTPFQGNAPGADDSVFSGATNVIVYYLSGTTGWGSTFAGQPTSLWTNPLLSGPVRATANALAFTISWAPNVTLVVEACSDLTRRAWTPISTNIPSSGSWHFSDSNLANYPLRFYRVRSP